MAGNVVRPARRRVGLLLAACAFIISAGPMSRAVAQRVAMSTPETKYEAGRVTVQVQNAPLSTVLRTIADQARLIPVFEEALLPRDKRITLVLQRVSADEAFQQALVGTNLVARLRAEGQVVIVRAAPVVEQGIVTGRVIHAKTKQPIAGASITLDDATRGIVTGEDGTFRISAAPGEHTIHIRRVGFARVSKTVTVAEGAPVTIEVALDPTASVLNEVVVTGTVVATERKAVPNPITVLTADDIEKRGVTRIEDLLRGEVPGVLALDQGTESFGGTLGAMVSSKVYARGSSGLEQNAQVNGSGTPLKTYVDGVELLDPSYLGTIDPRSIERIEIVTGPQAATIYGSGAMGGVMQIFTKKGAGRSTPDVAVSLKYGILENSLTDNLTPQHTHAVSLSGGTGPEFTYAGSLTYGSTGQWQPMLFTRSYGASVGATHTRGPFVISGSVSSTGGKNGTYTYLNPWDRVARQNGENTPLAPINSQRVAMSSSQTVSLSGDYRATSTWQHHATVGRSQTNLSLRPEAPIYQRANDSLYSSQKSMGSRVTYTYNTTYIAPHAFGLSNTMTLGLDGSTAEQVQVSGCLPAPQSTSYVACSSTSVSVYTPINSENFGAFGTWQLGFLNRLYITLGLRGEKSPDYGSNHKVDWTPSNGATYTVEYGDLTVKFLGSYGRATRAPTSSYRLPVLTASSAYDPGIYVSQFENPDLRPERSRGPQGGMELYYGNVGSLTINHYRQTVDDLIQRVQVDSFQTINVSSGNVTYLKQYQYVNFATVDQKGWEGTASLNLGPLTAKGTYSWADSRVTKRSGNILPYLQLPTHSGNVTLTYAHGGTSVALVTNYVGSVLVPSSFMPLVYQTIQAARLQTYLYRVAISSYNISRPGYVKSNLALAQRLRGWASATVNVTNLGNSYGSEGLYFTPTLGRVTTMGMTLRFPRAR